jgi:protein-disulfide isomerase
MRYEIYTRTINMKKQLSVLLMTTAFLAGCNKKEKAAEETKAVDTQTEQTVFSKAQVAAIEQIVHKYVVNNPNVLAESIMNLQKQVADKQQEKVVELLEKNKAELSKSAGLPFAGSPSADITILMFGDYTEPASKAMFKMYQNAVSKDKGLRVVFRFLPDTSALAQKSARVAMAMNDQGLFEKFHEKMMSNTEALTETVILEIAANIPGVNRGKLEADIDSGKTKEALLGNRKLAENLGISQAPGYIIGDFLLKQPVNPDDLDAVIKNIRDKKK